ncbi:MAG: tRNA epoxyqueuosine(34) reductase QueG [Rubritalea sp.]
MEVTSEQIKSSIKFIAKSLGFSDCRIAKVKPATHGKRFQEWVDAGTAGDMKWLEKNVDRRLNPAEVLEGAKSMVCMALNYYPGEHDPEDGIDYSIARYAWNEDYHDIIDEKLRDMNLAMEELGGRQRFYVDTGPILERDFASDAGLGWNGKSTIQIHKSLGTWTFLCELITTLDLEPDKPLADHCGKCTKCIDFCPTQAITGPREMDARRCISYLTIEHKGSIPLELRHLMGDKIYGCDICLEVCPWNRFAKLSRETKLHAKTEIFQHSLKDFLAFTDKDFRRVFAKSPIKRIKRTQFLRNVCVAVGNRADVDDLGTLEDLLLTEPDPLIREHAEWAVAEIKKTTSRD